MHLSEPDIQYLVFCQTKNAIRSLALMPVQKRLVSSFLPCKVKTSERAMLKAAYNIMDLREMAHRRLPRPMWDMLEGGAEDEVTLHRNTAAFDDFQLHTRSLVDVANIDLSARLFGETVSMPLILAPAGAAGLWHPDAELAVARAAHKAGIFMGVSTGATKTLGDIGDAAPGLKMFQLYALKDNAINTELMTRCRAAGYKSLCLTVDAAAGPGNRERDARNGMNPGSRLSLASVLSVAMHPRWAFNTFGRGGTRLATVESLMPPGRYSLQDVRQFLGQRMTMSMTWTDAERIAAEWNGPFAIKGILTPDDARQAVAAGATTIIISNHGGRQLDGVPATIKALPAIADAIGSDADIVVDSGIRRGTHVLKCLALGAKAAMIGRPYLYGLAAGAEAGVTRALEIFRSEIRLNMALMGVTSIADITSDLVTPA